MSYILSVDQSTQGTKALLFDSTGRLLCRRDVAHEQIINQQGWVSHDPEEIYRNTVESLRRVIEAAGVGYAMSISLTTYSAIQGKNTVKLYVYEAIREDAYVLYGFSGKKEREMFQLLITVSGVGANTARMVLSSMSVAELCAAISTGDERLIKSIKGIGLKTAQRIIVDLKDKIVALGIADELPAGGSVAVAVDTAVRDEAVAALTMLGFSPAPTQKVVVQILKDQPDAPVEQVVKLALKQIK